MIYEHLCTKVHMPSSSGLLVIAVKPRVKAFSHGCHTFDKKLPQQKLHIFQLSIIVYHFKTEYYVAVVLSFPSHKFAHLPRCYYCL
jgi:hypothetical protein